LCVISVKMVGSEASFYSEIVDTYHYKRIQCMGTSLFMTRLLVFMTSGAPGFFYAQKPPPGRHPDI